MKWRHPTPPYRMMGGVMIFSFIVLAIMVRILYLRAEEPPAPDPPPVRVGEAGKSSEAEGVELLEQGGQVYLKEKKIEIPGIIAHSDMPLELLACATGGKDYESLLVLKCSSHDISKIHLALILFGLEEDKEGEGPQFFGDPTKPTGDPVLVFVEWEEKDRTVCYRAEDLIIDLRTGKPMPRCGWAFTGSRVDDEIDFETGKPTGRKRYLANVTRTIIATYHDPSAILDNPTESGGMPHIYEPNWELLPKQVTEVKVTIRPPNKPELKEVKKIKEETSKWEKEWREKIKQAQEQEKEAEPGLEEEESK